MSLASTSVSLRRFWTPALARIAILSALCVLQPALASAQLIISELRLRGPAGPDDEFIEIYNSSGNNHTVAAAGGTGYGIAASDGVTRCTIPNGTVIPNRGHFLCVHSGSGGYSLGMYPAGNGTNASGDALYSAGIPDNAGVALFNNNIGTTSYVLGNRMDAVGSTSEANAVYKEGTGHLPLSPSPAFIDYSLVRKLVGGGCTGSGGGGNCTTVAQVQTTPGPVVTPLQDTDNNAVDFIFVETSGASVGAGQRLGAPGPENLSSPVSVDGIGLTASAADPSRPSNAPPNYVRLGGPWCGPPNPVVPPCDFGTNSDVGRMDIRQKFTNNTGANITRLRFRIVDITTFPAQSGVADLRPMTSGDIGDPILGTVRGTTLEQPPSQTLGSGFNGTLSVGAITLGAPLPPGGRIDVRFVLGVVVPGAARFCVAAEMLPATAASQVFCFINPTEGTIREISQTFSNSAAIVIPASGTGAATGAPATPYPPTITIAGFTGTVARVTVKLKQISHAFPGDIDVLLVGPTGAKFVLMSDALGTSDLTGQTYTFDDRASVALLSAVTGAPPPSGSFKPTNYGIGDLFPAPAPVGPYPGAGPGGTDTFASVFGGLNPNGAWRLYVVDDAPADTGAIAGGWELTLISACTAPLGAVEADFNGDCAGDISVYRPSTGEWFANNQAPVQFGLPGDVPVAGDYDADGKADRAVYRPSSGQWFVQNQATVQFGLPGDVPVAGDYNGDGTTDRAVFRPSTGQWFVQGQATVQFGLPGDQPVPGDYDGDRTTDRAVYRPSTGQWFAQGQATVQWGLPGDITVPADYDGNGTTDRAVFRPSTGQWFVHGQGTVQFGLTGDVPVPADYNGDGIVDRAVLRPATGQWFVQGQATVVFGLPGDLPVLRPDAVGDFNNDGSSDVAGYLGDYDGNGTTDVAVFRPSTGQWFVQNQVAVQFGLPGDIPVPGDYNGNGTTDRAVFRPSSSTWFVENQGSVPFGLPGDIPVPGDYDGNGTTDRAVFRPSTGEWFVQNQATVQFGLPGDVPVPGDYDGNGTTDRAVYRPSNGFWFVQNQAAVQFGLPGDVPVPGDYDGNGTDDRAVYRPSSGLWFVQNQATVQWGLPGDLPVPGDYDGNGTMDRAVYRPSSGTWFVQNQATVQWGLPGDIPASRAYSPR
jgi:subtilisin-like proprotein convertase family protein